MRGFGIMIRFEEMSISGGAFMSEKQTKKLLGEERRLWLLDYLKEQSRSYNWK